MPDWERLVNLDFEVAEKMLRSRGSISPMFIVHTVKGNIMAVGAGWGSDEEKIQVYRLMQVFCVAHNAVALSMIAEAWMSATPTKPDETVRQAYERVGKPADDPNRREVVWVVLSYREKGQRRSLLRYGEIIRDADGKPLSCTGDGKVDGTGEGDIGKILPETAPTKEQQLVAKEFMKRYEGKLEVHPILTIH